MARIRCGACGKYYDYYEHGCCPKCGAFNRPPRRNRVDVDGTVHHISDDDFLSNTLARRRSQGGKVCFERDECHEAQPRKVRSGPDLTDETDSPFNTRVKQTTTAREKKRSPVRIGVIVAIVVLLVNFLPLLTMCSISDVFDEIVSVEPVRPEQYPDGVVTYPVEVGGTFIWWDADARVEEVQMNEVEELTEVELVMWRAEDGEPPEIIYLLPDHTEVNAFPDSIGYDGEYYTYRFILPDRAVGSECYVLFAGYNNGIYCQLTLPLVASAEIDTVTSVTYISVEEPFFWWDEETVVTGADIVESGSSTEVQVIVVQSEGGALPRLWYFDESGQEYIAYCEEHIDLGAGKHQYTFRVDDRMPGSDCWAVFDGYNGGTYHSTHVLLT